MKDQRPRLSVVGLVHQGGKILLGQRPKGGKFVLPGGGVELGESLVTALRREVLEETGVPVVVNDSTVLDVMEIVGRKKHGEVKSHRVCLVIAAVAVPGAAPRSGDELQRVDFYDPKDLDPSEYAEATRECLKRLNLI